MADQMAHQKVGQTAHQMADQMARLKVGQWVGDISTRVYGAETRIINATVKASILLRRGFEQAGLRMAPKTVIVARSKDHAREAVAGLKAAAGIVVKSAADAADLGVDVAMAGHRPGANHRKRAKLAAAELKLVKRTSLQPRPPGGCRSCSRRPPWRRSKATQCRPLGA